jgi:predicted RNase H-like HicB family nuclease
MRYAVVIEKAEGNYSAYVPDLPGCVATGDTPEQAEKEIRDAIRFHLDDLKGRWLCARQSRGLCSPTSTRDGRRSGAEIATSSHAETTVLRETRTVGCRSDG